MGGDGNVPRGHWQVSRLLIIDAEWQAFADNAWRSKDLPCTWHAVSDPDEVAVFDLDLSITLSL